MLLVTPPSNGSPSTGCQLRDAASSRSPGVSLLDVDVDVGRRRLNNPVGWLLGGQGPRSSRRGAVVDRERTAVDLDRRALPGPEVRCGCPAAQLYEPNPSRKPVSPLGAWGPKCACSSTPTPVRSPARAMTRFWRCSDDQSSGSKSSSLIDSRPVSSSPWLVPWPQYGWL